MTKLFAPLTSLIFIVGFVFGTEALGQNINRQQFLAPIEAVENGAFKVAFFDADSTLRVSSSGSPSANGPNDYNILPGVVEKLRELNKQGFIIVIVSNQAGIPKYISLENADAAIFNMIQDLKKDGAIVHYYDFAENADDSRKPGIGMGTRLEEKLKAQFGQSAFIDKTQSMMVGDSAYKKTETRPDGRAGFNFSNSDRLFAANYGVEFKEPQHYFGWIGYGVELIESKKDLLDLQNKMGTASNKCGGLMSGT